MQSMSDYYSAVQLRADRWGELRAQIEQLSKHPDGRGAKGAHERI